MLTYFKGLTRTNGYFMDFICNKKEAIITQTIRSPFFIETKLSPLSSEKQDSGSRFKDCIAHGGSRSSLSQYLRLHAAQEVQLMGITRHSPLRVRTPDYRTTILLGVWRYLVGGSGRMVRQGYLASFSIDKRHQLNSDVLAVTRCHCW